LACGEAATNALTVHNKGIGGHNSDRGRARFEKDVVALKPGYVFIYFGLNDTLNEPAFVPLDRFIANLTWMIARARAAHVEPVLCTIHRVTEEPLLKRHKRESYGTEGPNGKIARYNAALRALARAAHVRLADFAAAVDAAPPSPAIVSPDGVHLTADGYRFLARCFLDAVSPQLKGNETIVCLGDSVTFGAGMKGKGTADGETYPAFLRQLPISRKP
jgi:acyl-CoA thioesterase-1